MWKHASLNATTLVAAYDKCGSDDRICEDNDDTCVIMHETLEMSAKHVYMMIQLIFTNIGPWRKPKIPFAWQAINPMPRDETFCIKIKAWTTLKIEEGSLKWLAYQQLTEEWLIDHRIHNRLQNFSASQNFGRCCNCYNTSLFPSFPFHQMQIFLHPCPWMESHLWYFALFPPTPN